MRNQYKVLSEKYKQVQEGVVFSNIQAEYINAVEAAKDAVNEYRQQVNNKIDKEKALNNINDKLIRRTVNPNNNFAGVMFRLGVFIENVREATGVFVDSIKNVANLQYRAYHKIPKIKYFNKPSPGCLICLDTMYLGTEPLPYKSDTLTSTILHEFVHYGQWLKGNKYFFPSSAKKKYFNDHTEVTAHAATLAALIVNKYKTREIALSKLNDIISRNEQEWKRREYTPENRKKFFNLTYQYIYQLTQPKKP